MYTYIYIYIYICMYVCVCARVYTNVFLCFAESLKFNCVQRERLLFQKKEQQTNKKHNLYKSWNCGEGRAEKETKQIKY